MAVSCETIDLLLDRGRQTGEGFLSTQLLYKFLHNNLRVGQWELARACITTLLQKDGKNREAFGELLKNIVQEPLSYCDGSPSVPTPFHLSWLASLEILKHFKGKVDLPQSVQKKTEFRLLLQSCDKENIPLNCLQELDDYYSKIIDKSGSKTIPEVSVSWRNPLKILIENQPELAHVIIHCLIVKDPRYAANNDFFYNLYLDLLKCQLTKLTSLENTLKRTNDSGESGESAKSELNTCCRTIHRLLSSIFVQSLSTQSEIDEVLMNLVYEVQKNPCGSLTKGSLYSALLCQQTLCLFKRFCDIETEHQLGNTYKSLAEVPPSPTFFIPSESLFTRTCDKDRPSAWKLLFLYARQNHHVLEDVVTTCVEFVRQGDLNKVTEILSCEEFLPLKVLVLLLAWPYCHTCDSAQALLDTLWDHKISSKHILLDQACARLEYQLHLVKWCLDKAKLFIAANESSSTEEREKVYEMFQNLDSHSVLHVLHQSTNLSQLPENEVLEILKTRPVFSSESNSALLGATGSPGISSDSEIRRDVALYHAFCALRAFLEIIAAGYGENPGSDVATKIQESREHVNSIYPLTFRVEILENIFSLLFVSSEHLLDEISAAFETDDLETLDSQSLRSSRTASFESFLSFDSRTGSPWKPSRTSEQRTPGSMSPEPSFKHSPSIDKDRDDIRQSDLSKVRTASPEGNSRRSTSARELSFDDVNVEHADFNEMFSRKLASSKEKLFNTSEQNVKGLLMNGSMVRQFLDVLKKCLNDVVRLKTESSESTEIHAEWINSSVSIVTLEQRISRLGQYINEGQWRHQLVSICCDYEDLEDDVFDDPSGFFSDDSDIDLDVGKSEAGKQEQDISSSSRWRKNVNGQGEFGKHLRKMTSPREAGIPRLLSSPRSLIYMCMKKDNYAQAKHIIKLFNIEEDESSKAVHFAEEYHKSFQKLTQAEKLKSKAKTPSKTTEKKGRLSVLKNVASVAAAGIAATSVTSIVEELLLSASTDLATCGFALTEPAHAHFLHALVCFDLMCTGQLTKMSCKNFLEMAMKKMEIAMDIEPLTPYTLQRVAEMLNKLESLLNDTDSPGAVGTHFSDIKPLNAKSVKTDRDMQTHQDNSFMKLEEAIDDGDTVIKSIGETTKSELPAVLKFKKIERKAAVRVAMVDFHNAFDCTRDERLLVVARTRWLKIHRLDYVQSLYNHVNLLSTWELYWKLSSKEMRDIPELQKSIALKATNPFVVLTQGFDDIAGKPLFERNVPPKKMESMCRKMNVNLIRIIVHNCCPVVPAFGPLRRQDSLLSSSSKVVLNSPQDDDRVMVDKPVSFSEMLVVKIKELLEGMKDPESNAVDIQSLLVLSTSPSYVLLLKEVQKLRWIDLDVLVSDEDKICFFTNVLNMLLCHAVITELAGRYSTVSTGSRSESPVDRNVGSKSWGEGLLRLDYPYCRTSYLKKYGYIIGKLGFVSAFDLWFTILRAGLPYPSNLKDVQLHSQMSYLYQHYQPKTSDFRLTFVICDGTVSSPEMQALNKENIETQLNDAISTYLGTNIDVIDEDKIYLPELLKWYKEDFMSTFSASSSEPSQFNGGENYVELLFRMSPYLHGEQFRHFDDIAPQLSVAFTPHCWLLGFHFSATGTKIQRETPSQSDAAIAPKYTLTQSLSNYLVARSPLVASLANLSCSQDSNRAPKASQKEEEFPLLTTSLANHGTRSLEVVSPFEFAMNQAIKFPVLQRHIASAFLSVSKFLYLDGLGLTKSPQSNSASAELAARSQSRLFLLDEQSPEVSEMFLRALNYAWCKSDGEFLLEIFNSACLNQNGTSHGPEDFAIEMAFMSGLELSTDDDIAALTASTLRNFNIPAPTFSLNWKENKWLLLYRIKDDCTRAKIVLQCLHNWSDVDVCLNLLKFCLSKPPEDKELLASLEKKTRQLNLCKKVSHCHSNQEFAEAKIYYETWKSVVEYSVRNPELVLEELQNRQRFELVREWIDVYGYPAQLHEKIREDYLTHLLTKTPVDVTEVYLYLEEIKDPAKTLQICERLLSKEMPVTSVIFIIQFMITDLAAHVKPARQRELLRHRLGANAILCIPESNRNSYESLASRPLLLLEQLLIDMKVEWAGKVFEDLQTEIRTDKNYDESLGKEISVAFDRLLVWYATKALEFEVVTYEEKEETVDESNTEKAKSLDSRSIRTSTPIKSHQRHASIGAMRSSRKSSENEQYGAFRIPDKIPAEEDWEPDYKHSVCMICEEVVFNMFVRRHHCRRCGRVVCDTCSPFKRVLSAPAPTPVRVCKDCDKAMFEQSYRQKESGRTIHSGSLPTYMSTSLEGRANAEFQERLELAVLKLEDMFSADGNQGGRLSLDEDCNKIIREAFLYEQAPSSFLCTSILALHENSKTCAELLLGLCNKLSQKLGMSEEIDNNLLIRYMSRVELVKFLIESNFYEVPSIEDLMSAQTARRLRDKLIENESLFLAMEVTTKCGLDPGAVWGAWGLAYLQVGKFKEARQTFSKLLKPAERGKTTQGNIRYLKMVIDILETSPMVSFDYLTVGDFSASLASLREHAKNSSGTRNMDPKRFEECVFYLSTYGSYSAIVTFYVNHNHLKLACRFILEKRCPPDVFTEHLLMPAIRHGQFEHLRDLLKMFDPSLEVWMPHLNGACRYLSRLNFFNVLYQIQILMKDHFRAAMTCIKFYQGLPHGTATSYADLFSRLKYLQDALAHLEAVRKHQLSKKGTLAMVTSSLQKNMGESGEQKSRMSVTPTELTTYMNTITLQMEVTKFMHNCWVDGTLRKSKDVKEKIGTLFDNATTKCDVVSKMLLAGHSVNDGFSLSCRIIQDFRLPALNIYKQVAETLASDQKFAEIQVLLSNAIQTRLMNDKDHDSVILTMLGILTDDDKKWKHAEALIKSLKDEGKKVAAYIRFRRLKTAYLIAVASDRVNDVKAIANMAKATEQMKVYNICMKWLEGRETKQQR